ncbi:hypothetical protein CA850_14850 [Micromonospora echinospora]|uniref:Uncharacterized protein n=1 Tax=Micromonospora echinospora TaxID=1877 RepID=A0A1C4W7T7_MICEC|nr:hypothetical protein CA850_14850 [Micromonospora echinospora]SCE92286.1 hypothetical protein GA0070618_1937 [Micromonospora echinospora]
MDDDAGRRPTTRDRTVRRLRVASLWADAAVVVATVSGREDISASAGALSTTFRCAAELLEGPSQR